MWSEWDSIKAAVLVVRGAQSDLLTAPVAAQMTQRGPQAKLVEFQDCGHTPHMFLPEKMAPVLHHLANNGN